MNASTRFHWCFWFIDGKLCVGGKGGATIKELRENTGAKISIGGRGMELGDGSPKRECVPRNKDAMETS